MTRTTFAAHTPTPSTPGTQSPCSSNEPYAPLQPSTVCAGQYNRTIAQSHNRTINRTEHWPSRRPLHATYKSSIHIDRCMACLCRYLLVSRRDNYNLNGRGIHCIARTLPDKAQPGVCKGGCAGLFSDRLGYTPTKDARTHVPWACVLPYQLIVAWNRVQYVYARAYAYASGRTHV
jgi:hypothetical protein